MSDAASRQAVLAPLRERINDVDDRLVELLAERMRYVEEVIAIKRGHNLPARIDSRVEEVVTRVRSRAQELGAPADLAETVWRTMIDWVIAYEDRRLES